MRRNRFTYLLPALLLLVVPPYACAQSQSYPAKPIRVVVGFAGGGAAEIAARIVGQVYTERWGQQVVIDPRPGAGGNIASELVAKSPPDGYTLYLGGVTTLVLAVYVHKNMPYDPQKDFVPVSQTTISPLLLMAHPTLPAKTVKEFVALAHARPGEINYATSGPGGSGHLAGELFRMVTKTNIVHVPYRGAPPAINDLAAGQVQTLFGSMLAAVPHVRSGKIHAIAVTGPQRSMAVPQVPTFAESGLPNYDASTWNGILVPTGTPRAIIERLHAELAKILRTPNVLDRLSGDGPIGVGNTPEEFVAYIKAEHAKWGKVVREANIRVE